MELIHIFLLIFLYTTLSELIYVLLLIARSGTEEEFTELSSLLEDIITYRRDMATIIKNDKELKKKKDQEDKIKGEKMRQAALSGLASKSTICIHTVI